MQQLLLAGLSMCSVPTVHSQVLPFNEAGVTMGHHHIMVPDDAAQRTIWVDILGGELQGDPPLQLVKFPGTFLNLSEGSGTEGTHGSALDRFAFNLRDQAATKGVECERLFGGAIAVITDPAGVAIAINAGLDCR